MDRNNNNGDELRKKIRLIVNEFDERLNAGYAMRAHDDEEIKWKLHEIEGNFKDMRFSDLEPEVIYDALVSMNTRLTLILSTFELQKKCDAMEAENKKLEAKTIELSLEIVGLKNSPIADILLK